GGRGVAPNLLARYHALRGGAGQDDEGDGGGLDAWLKRRAKGQSLHREPDPLQALHEQAPFVTVWNHEHYLHTCTRSLAGLRARRHAPDACVLAFSRAWVARRLVSDRAGLRSPRRYVSIRLVRVAARKKQSTAVKLFDP